MSIYIVQPQQTLLGTALTLSPLTDSTVASRQAQIEEVRSLQMEHPIYRKVQAWIDASPRVLPLVEPGRQPVITATAIVEMPDEEAERMRQEIPEAAILRNQPMNLIPPKRTAPGAKAGVTAADLWHLQVIGLEAARQAGFNGTGKDVTIAVLDTGIDATHPELQGKVAEAYTFDVSGQAVQPIHPSRDTHGHGTHVAGLICGTNVGVAPEARLLSGVLLPRGQGSLADFILALNWVAQRPDIQIVNISGGIPGHIRAMHQAIADVQRAGVLVIAAIGNDGRNTSQSPANYAQIVAVGASNDKGRVAGFSGGGQLIVDSQVYPKPDLVAPGVQVYSSVPGGGYKALSGTSLAAPIVAGVAALIFEKYKREISVLDVIEELRDMCQPLAQGGDSERQGRGLIRVM